MKNLFYFSIISLGLSVGCQSPDNHELLAKEACACMEPLSQLYAQLQTVLATGDLEALDELSEQILVQDEEVDACAERLEEIHGPMEGAQGEAVKEAMKEQCPDIIRIMNQAEETLTQ